MRKRSVLVYAALLIFFAACNHCQESATSSATDTLKKVTALTEGVTVTKTNFATPTDLANHIMNAIKNNDYSAYTSCLRTKEDIRYIFTHMEMPGTDEKGKEKMKAMMNNMLEKTAINDSIEAKKAFDGFMQEGEQLKANLKNITFSVMDEGIGKEMGSETANTKIAIKEGANSYETILNFIKAEKGWVINFAGMMHLSKI